MTSELDHYQPAELDTSPGILGLAPRYRELGRLRMGERIDTGRQKNGKPIMRPAKLDVWRLTSTDWRLIKRAADLYGGEPETWADAPGWNHEKKTGVRQFQVTTDANDVPVMLPPEIALTQAMEAWTAGQCLRRCDGAFDKISGAECLCRDEVLDGGTQACKPTTRLSVLLIEMPGLGVWRLETHGWYAASELVPMVRMAATFGAGQSFRLRIDPRQRQTQGADGKLVTYHFGVPVLDTDLTPGQLLAATAAPAVELAGRMLEQSDPGSRASSDAVGGNPASASPGSGQPSGVAPGSKSAGSEHGAGLPRAHGSAAHAAPDPNRPSTPEQEPRTDASGRSGVEGANHDGNGPGADTEGPQPPGATEPPEGSATPPGRPSGGNTSPAGGGAKGARPETPVRGRQGKQGESHGAAAGRATSEEADQAEFEAMQDAKDDGRWAR